MNGQDKKIPPEENVEYLTDILTTIFQYYPEEIINQAVTTAKIAAAKKRKEKKLKKQS